MDYHACRIADEGTKDNQFDRSILHVRFATGSSTFDRGGDKQYRAEFNRITIKDYISHLYSSTFSSSTLRILGRLPITVPTETHFLGNSGY